MIVCIDYALIFVVGCVSETRFPQTGLGEFLVFVYESFIPYEFENGWNMWTCILSFMDCPRKNPDLVSKERRKKIVNFA